MCLSVKTMEEIPPIYLEIHLKILFYLGIDIIPIESTFKRVLFHIYTVFIIGLMLLFTVTEFLDMVLNFEDIYKMTFALCYFVTHVLGTAKMFLMLFLRKKLWHHLQTLETGVFKPNINRGGSKEFELVQNGINLCKRQGFFFYTFVIVIIGARTIYAALANLPYDKHNYVDGNITIIDNKKIMPYTTWMPFIYNDSPLYELIFGFQIFSTVVYGYYIGAADAVICGFLILIKAQFLILKRELETLVERANFEVDNQSLVRFQQGVEKVELLDDKTQMLVSKFANECAFHHQELITLCDQSEEDFCYLMLLQFIASLLILCFQLFQLSALSLNSVEFFSMSMYLVLMLFQLLCYCWHGNEIQLVSGQISTNVFDIDWIVMNESVKNSLLLIMMRSQRPNYFTAGKFSLLSLETFMTIVRGAASYFMFLKQMND